MRVFTYIISFIIACIIIGSMAIVFLYNHLQTELPDVATLKDVQLQTPMQVYSADNLLIAQYGEKRRIPLSIHDIPQQLIDAVIATEDSRFYEHSGLDIIGITRASLIALSSGHASQGASTITQQLARNFFLSPEKKLTRKIKEAFLAIKIEKTLTKSEILALYLNKIYLGNRAYGVGAAAQVYFGKSVNQLTLSEMAMIAGLPKAPSSCNPLHSKKCAINRRNVVLSRMLQQHYITQQQYNHAYKEPLVASYHVPKIDFSAPYLSEMVRQEMVKRYGEKAYIDGFKVYTTITKPIQLAAEKAVLNNIFAYDMRHGYRGPEKTLWQPGQTIWPIEKIITELKKTQHYGDLKATVVLNVTPEQASLISASGEEITLNYQSVKWARAYKSDTAQGPSPKKVSDVLKPGQQIWVRKINQDWYLSQLPTVNSALISINSEDGSIQALVGGFNFEQNKFNRVTQAIRQIGSNIKPFIYAAALNKGMTLATLINDAPITSWDLTDQSDWRPKNSPPVYAGPIRLREALALSKNVVMVRTMQAIGVNYSADFLLRFGFPNTNIMRTDSLALGSASFTPLQLVRAYATFANGGFLVEPYFIKEIKTENNKPLFLVNPKQACSSCHLPVIYTDDNQLATLDNSNNGDKNSDNKIQLFTLPQYPKITNELAENNTVLSAKTEYAPHVIRSEVAFLISNALNSNIFGEAGSGWLPTGWRGARDLKRHDIGGKTGTTNNSKDAWFSGYGANLVTSVWIGFDDHRRTLGTSSYSGMIKDQISGWEGGAKSAQPAWNDFMKKALTNLPEKKIQQPENVVTIRINRTTGELTSQVSNSRLEYFIKGTEPKYQSSTTVGSSYSENGITHELF